MTQKPVPIGQAPGGPVGLLASLHPAIIDGVEAGLVIIDTEYHIRASNRFVQEWVKRTAEEMYGQYCFDVFHQFESVCRAPEGRAQGLPGRVLVVDDDETIERQHPPCWIIRA